MDTRSKRKGKCDKLSRRDEGLKSRQRQPKKRHHHSPTVAKARVVVYDMWRMSTGGELRISSLAASAQGALRPSAIVCWRRKRTLVGMRAASDNLYNRHSKNHARSHVAMLPAWRGFQEELVNQSAYAKRSLQFLTSGL